MGRSKLIPIGSVSSVEVELGSFDCTGEDESLRLGPLRLGQSLCCRVSVDKGVSV